MLKNPDPFGASLIHYHQGTLAISRPKRSKFLIISNIEGLDDLQFLAIFGCRLLGLVGFKVRNSISLLVRSYFSLQLYLNNHARDKLRNLVTEYTDSLSALTPCYIYGLLSATSMTVLLYYHH